LTTIQLQSLFVESHFGIYAVKYIWQIST
jgi:hypothetical protein